MRKNFSVFLATVCTLLMVIANNGFAFAAEFSNDKLNNCYLDVMNEYNNNSDNLTFDYDDKYYDIAMESNEINGKLLDYVEINDDILSQSYGGSYIDDDGYLNIMLTGNQEECNKIIFDMFAYDNPCTEIVKYSYKEIMAEKDKIDSSMEAYITEVNSGKMNAETQSLINSIQTVSYDDINNQIVVSLCNNTDSAAIAMQSDESQYHTNMNDQIDTFKEKISDSDIISFDIVNDEIEMTATEWRPGRGIFVAKTSTTLSGCSTGYRAKYKYNGTTYSGFVTCAHGNSTGKNVYLSTTATSANKIGTILNRSLTNNSNVDVAFIKMASGYTNSNAIYYTSSQPGVTRQGTVLDGTQTTVTVGLAVFKSGVTTYLTSGKVTSTNTSGYVNVDGTKYLIKDMFATGSISSSGDSGGVTYIINSGAASGKAVGTVEAGNSSTSLFVKASNIKSTFGAYSY